MRESKNADDGGLSESLAATTELFKKFVANPPTVTEDHTDREYFGSYIKGALKNMCEKAFGEAKDTINSMLSWFAQKKKHAIPVHTAPADVVVLPITPEVVDATAPASSMWTSAPSQFQGPSSVNMQPAQFHAAPPRFPRFQQQPQYYTMQSQLLQHFHPPRMSLRSSCTVSAALASPFAAPATPFTEALHNIGS